MKKTLTIITTAAVMLTCSTSAIAASADHTIPNTNSVVSVLGASAPATVKVNSAYSSSTNAVRIKWGKVSGANGYRVYRYNTDTKKWVKIKTITNGNTLEYRDSGLNSGTRYKYKVKAYKKSGGKTIWGSASATKTTVTKPAAVKFGAFSATQTSIRLNWTPVECEGYQIYQLIGGKYVKIDTIRDKNTGTYKISGLDAETKYNFKIRAFSKDGCGKVLYTSYATKTKTTKGIEWSEVDKAYYHMACGYPTEEQCELVRKDICDYIMKNYSKQKHIKVDTSAYRVFHVKNSESFNPNTMKFEKETTGSSYQVSDAHCDHSIEMNDLGIIPKKNGYTKENYEAIQNAKQEIYDWLGYDALFNTYVGNATYTEDKPLLFNIGIERIPDAVTYIDDEADYYDDKDPWNIPQYNLWFCNVTPNTPR